MDNLYGVDKETWFSYESLRRSGIMNMWGSQDVLGLTKEEFLAIIEHYSEMNDAWKNEFEKINGKE